MAGLISKCYLYERFFNWLKCSFLGQTFYHWENYSDLFEARNTWANQLITHFKEQYLRLKSEGKIDDLVATELNFYGTNPVSIEARSRKKKV